MKKILLTLLVFGFSFFISKAQKPSCAFSITTSVYQSVQCFGMCNAIAVAYAHSGTPPYRWNSGPLTHNASDTVTGLCAGVYTVTATDSNGCSASATVTISQPPLLSIWVASYVSPSCNNCPNGSITTNASGGVAPYSYQWTPNVSTSYFATGLTAGSYTCCVTDAHNCTSCTSYTFAPINEVSAPELDFSVLPNPNNGQFNLSIKNYELGMNGNVEIYNMLGEIVYSQLAINNSQFKIDISALGKGVYILAIKTKTQTAVKKVVVY